MNYPALLTDELKREGEREVVVFFSSLEEWGRRGDVESVGDIERRRKRKGGRLLQASEEKGGQGRKKKKKKLL